MSCGRKTSAAAGRPRADTESPNSNPPRATSPVFASLCKRQCLALGFNSESQSAPASESHSQPRPKRPRCHSHFAMPTESTASLFSCRGRGRTVFQPRQPRHADQLIVIAGHNRRKPIAISGLPVGAPGNHICLFNHRLRRAKNSQNLGVSVNL